MSDICQEKCDKCGTSTNQPTPKANGPGNTWNDSFNRAKKTLEKQVFTDYMETFYCNCAFDEEKKFNPAINTLHKKGVDPYFIHP
jgi:rRNA maturation protein Nop10